MESNKLAGPGRLRQYNNTPAENGRNGPALVGRFRRHALAQPWLALSFAAYAWLFPWATGLVAADAVPAGTGWMASLMLWLAGLVAALWLGVNFGARRGGLAALSVMAGAWAVEACGVTTGFPFGRYIYTDNLILKLGPVPLGILCAWLMIVVAAFFTARRLWPALGAGSSVAAGAGLALLSDIIMEPVATRIQAYWLWQESGPYYGVPTANFAAWFVAALLLIALLAGLTGATRAGPALRYPVYPLALFFTNLLMFTAINLGRGHLLAGLIGLAAGLLLGLRLLAVRPAALTPAAGTEAPEK